jgi:hypothetical protein
MGTPAHVYNATLFPGGIAAGLVGTGAHVYNFNQQFWPSSINPLPQTGPEAGWGVPQPWASYLNRNLAPGGIGTLAFGTTLVSNIIRTVDLAGRGPNTEVVGGQTIWFAERGITVPWIATDFWGTAKIGIIQTVSPAGWQEEAVSSNAELDINLQRIFGNTGSADEAGYGVTQVRNQFENVYPATWVDDQINFPVVYNLTQELFVQPYEGTNSDPTAWPNWYPFVENAIRYIGPFGWPDDRFPTLQPFIWNWATALYPTSGWNDTTWGSGTFIAYKNRDLPAFGWDSFYSSNWHAVYNNARVVAPSGVSSFVSGSQGPVYNLNRTMQQVFPSGPESLGTAFIDFRIRYVNPHESSDPPAPGISDVRLNPYPITPAGWEEYGSGGQYVYIHWNTAFPSSTNVHSVPWVGEPFVHNRNMSLTPYAYDMSLLGRPAITNYIQYPPPIGMGSLAAYGSTLVAYRNRTFAAYPVQAPPYIPTTLQIRKLSPDPPSLQTVSRAGGIGPDHLADYIGIVVIKLRTIFCSAINDALSRIGSAVVRANEINLDDPARGIFTLDQFGIPTVPGPRWVYPNVFDQSAQYGKPRFDPHNIYAPGGDAAPPGYVENNGGGEWIDTDVDYLGVSSNLVVSNYYRWLYAYGYPDDVFGEPKIDLRRRYVYPYPFVPDRWGTVVFWGVTQYLYLDELGASPQSPGVPVVSHPPPPPPNPWPISPAGFVATSFGTSSRAELKNRNVYPVQINHSGNPQQGLTSPWGLPLIGYPRTYSWGAYSFTKWGVPRVEFRIRNLYPFGWDSFSEYDEDLNGFNFRTRVSRRNPTEGLLGIRQDSYGSPMVSFSTRTILSRGWLDDYIGSRTTPQRVVMPAAWESMLIGNVDRWEAGKIKAAGDELWGPGYPTMGRVALAQAIDPSGLGDARVAIPVYTYSVPPIGFDGPVLTNMAGCFYVAIPSGSVSFDESVSTPAVSHV